jgi:hypothetical protein
MPAHSLFLHEQQYAFVCSDSYAISMCHKPVKLIKRKPRQGLCTMQYGLHVFSLVCIKIFQKFSYFGDMELTCHCGCVELETVALVFVQMLEG